jgi:histone H3/H4
MAKKAATKATKKSKEVLIVGSKLKAYVRAQGAMSSGELVGAVSDQVYGIIDRAIVRAQSNKRSTVQPRDL